MCIVLSKIIKNFPIYYKGGKTFLGPLLKICSAGPGNDTKDIISKVESTLGIKIALCMVAFHQR